MPADVVANHIAWTANQMQERTRKRASLDVEGFQEAVADGTPAYLLIDLYRLRAAWAVISGKLLSTVQADVLLVRQGLI